MSSLSDAKIEQLKNSATLIVKASRSVAIFQLIRDQLRGDIPANALDAISAQLTIAALSKPKD